ncbi:modular serine protease-like [Glandiceps talaboti]
MTDFCLHFAPVQHNIEVAELQCTGMDVPCNDDSACINLMDLCNGKKDCADGLDESPLLCGTKRRSVEVAELQCTGMDVLCNDGSACYNILDLCDGENDCADGIDESPLLCGTKRRSVEVAELQCTGMDVL